MLHLDFVHPDSALDLLNASQHAFLMENKTLDVAHLTQVSVHQNWLHAGIWQNGKRLPETWLHADWEHEQRLAHIKILPPPPKIALKNRLCLWAVSQVAGGMKSPII